MQLMVDMQQPRDYSVGLYCDNESAIHLAENLMFPTRTKHIEVQHHSLREKVLIGGISLLPINMEE